MQPDDDNTAIEEIEKRILRFVRSELTPTEAAVEPDDELLSGELLDSMAVLRLATFVADEFALEIQPADFVIENFRSVRVLARYVRRATRRAS